MMVEHCLNWESFAEFYEEFSDNVKFSELVGHRTGSAFTLTSILRKILTTLNYGVRFRVVRVISYTYFLTHFEVNASSSF